ncbi:tetratricopeptide repeat protein [Sandaracinobacteroides saxicola]|uniref:Tetratricopeptide repeat protein n=1 Tax=Sandaracinobacteroides saxicola TaxID=2759707 RepID=A0A7G5IED5_9SPHN|nr:tetratricopeptide repeat protein [Sandaracinobacteroides saxicola]QMW21727.1 tetratricopeptide repeat protein [Sandaracinobacteroides saxicola]
MTLKWNCLESVAAIAVGAAACFLTGRPDTGIIVGSAVGGAKLAGLLGEARQSHGIESEAELTRIRNDILAEWEACYPDGADRFDLDSADNALARLLPRAMPDTDTLGRLVATFDYPGQVADLVIASLARRDSRFEPDGIERRFARTVIIAALDSALVNPAYTQQLIVPMLRGLGEAVARVEAGVGRVESGQHNIIAKLDGLEAAIARIQAASPSPAIAETAVQTLTTLAQSPDPALRAVADADSAGDPDAAYAQLMALGEADVTTAADRFRNAAALAAPFNVTRAIAAYARATDLDPHDFWTWINLVRLHVAEGSLPAARATLDRAAQIVGDEREQSIVANERGDIAVAEGDLPAARAAYAASLAIAERLAARDPGNSARQRDLSISHNKLGDIAVAEGDLPAARAAYAASLAIAERLAARDPGNSEWQRDLSVSHDRLGNIARAEGNLPAARAAYVASLAIRDRLAARDPGNSEWQRDLSVSHNKLGDIARAEGDLPAARAAYAADLAIAERLAARDPGNSEWQRDLSVSHERLGDIARAEGDLPAARAAYAAGLAIRESLAARDPGNSKWQRDLSVSHERLGDIAVAEGDLPAAFACYRRSLPIAQALAEKWPTNPGFAKDLAFTRQRLATLEAELRGRTTD